MPGFDDVINWFNWIDKAHGVLDALLNFARKGRGNVELRVRRAGSFSGAECERMLKRYGVPISARSVTTKHFRMRVHAQQAKWAEYLLLRMGAQLDSTLREPRNGAWAAGHTEMPPAWAEKRISGRKR